MKFRFPVIIIDEDFRSENSSGLSIRSLARAIESEGFEVLGVTSYGDLSKFAQQQSRASAFVLSIDDEEFSPGPDLDPAVVNLRSFIEEVIEALSGKALSFVGELSDDIEEAPAPEASARTKAKRGRRPSCFLLRLGSGRRRNGRPWRTSHRYSYRGSGL